MANTWNESGTTWSTGRWGTTEPFTSGWGVDAWNTGGSWGQATDEVVQLTGQSITTELGTLISFPEQGWGRDGWSLEPYGDSFSPVVSVSGFSLTASLGDAIAFPESGWGSDTWNFESWGFNGSIIIPTSQAITTSVGEITAFPEQGWGGDTWNFESWGFNGLTVELDGQSITSDLGANGWSNASYGDNGWGMFTVNPADVVGLTGQEITSAVPSQLDIPEQIQGVSITSSVGSITPDQITLGLSGQSGTLSVGTTAFDLTSVVVPTGQEITGSVGETIEGTIEFIPVTGVSATLSAGSISLDQMTVGPSGQSGTLSVGSISPTEMSVGLSGQQITSSVAGFGTASGFGIQAYSDVDTGSNSSYTDVATGSNTSYTDAA